jgi:hypothetical protein
MAAGGDAIALSAPEKSRSPRGVSLWSILCRVASQHRAPPLPHSASGQSDLSQICRRSRSPTGNPSLARDEGPGIPRSERENVFEPFYRIGEARDPDTGGVGLGLSVTRSIVWEHGGDIILGNRKGGGLRVSVKLPVGQRSIPDRDGTLPHGQKPEPSSGDTVADEPRGV